MGHGYSKWFTRYRKDVHLYRKGVDFHLFRHTATTLMQRADVPISALDELTATLLLAKRPDTVMD